MFEPNKFFRYIWSMGKSATKLYITNNSSHTILSVNAGPTNTAKGKRASTSEPLLPGQKCEIVPERNAIGEVGGTIVVSYDDGKMYIIEYYLTIGDDDAIEIYNDRCIFNGRLRGKFVNLTTGTLAQKLLAAIKAHDKVTTRNLLSDSADIDLNTTNEDGETAVLIAAKIGDLQLMKILLGRNNVRLDVADSNKDTVLIHAVASGNVAMVRYLLREKRALLNANAGQNGNTAFHVACGLGDLLMVKELFKAVELFDLSVKNDKGKSTVEVAILLRQVHIVRYFKRVRVNDPVLQESSLVEMQQRLGITVEDYILACDTDYPQQRMRLIDPLRKFLGETLSPTDNLFTSTLKILLEFDDALDENGQRKNGNFYLDWPQFEYLRDLLISGARGLTEITSAVLYTILTILEKHIPAREIPIFEEISSATASATSQNLLLTLVDKLNRNLTPLTTGRTTEIDQQLSESFQLTWSERAQLLMVLLRYQIPLVVDGYAPADFPSPAAGQFFLRNGLLRDSFRRFLEQLNQSEANLTPPPPPVPEMLFNPDCDAPDALVQPPRTTAGISEQARLIYPSRKLIQETTFEIRGSLSEEAFQSELISAGFRDGRPSVILYEQAIFTPESGEVIMPKLMGKRNDRPTDICVTDGAKVRLLTSAASASGASEVTYHLTVAHGLHPNLDLTNNQTFAMVDLIVRTLRSATGCIYGNYGRCRPPMKDRDVMDYALLSEGEFLDAQQLQTNYPNNPNVERYLANSRGRDFELDFGVAGSALHQQGLHELNIFANVTDKRLLVHKRGCGTGLTVGVFHSISQQNTILIEQMSGSVRPFTDAGDCGAIIYLEVQKKLMPLSLHYSKIIRAGQTLSFEGVEVGATSSSSSASAADTTSTISPMSLSSAAINVRAWSQSEKLTSIFTDILLFQLPNKQILPVNATESNLSARKPFTPSSGLIVQFDEPAIGQLKAPFYDISSTRYGIKLRDLRVFMDILIESAWSEVKRGYSEVTFGEIAVYLEQKVPLKSRRTTSFLECIHDRSLTISEETGDRLRECISLGATHYLSARPSESIYETIERLEELIEYQTSDDEEVEDTENMFIQNHPVDAVILWLDIFSFYDHEYVNDFSGETTFKSLERQRV